MALSVGFVLFHLVHISWNRLANGVGAGEARATPQGARFSWHCAEGLPLMGKVKSKLPAPLGGYVSGDKHLHLIFVGFVFFF